MKKQYIVIVAGVVLVVLFALGAYFYQSQQTKKYGFMARQDASIFVRDHSQTLGEAEARVYLVEFSDPACETCRSFHSYVKEMMAANPGKIKLVIRYAPFHDGADYFVKILEAARKQGRYWETLDIMYKSQPYWASHHNPRPDLIWQFLPMAGLDLDKIRTEMNDPAIAKLIAQDMADAKTLNVRKTPGFFVNGKPLQNFGYNQLKELLEAEIKAVY